MSKSVLESLSNVFGRVRRSDVRMYAERVGRDAFLENIRCPSLLGVGRFAGEFVERAKARQTSTMAFRPSPDNASVAEESPETGIHESLYPLMVPADQIAGTKLFRIGRASSNEIVIPDYSISDAHALILYEKRSYRLEDLLSTNGTEANGVPVWGKGVELRDGDRIKVGRFQFLLLWPPALYKALTALSAQAEAEKPPPIHLEDLTDAMGRFDFINLKQYCRSVSKAEFKKLVQHPVLVGSAFFPATAWQEKEEETLPPFSSGVLEAKTRTLAGSMFPLRKNPDSNTDEESFIIGRAVSSDLRMNDPAISKQHARIEIKTGKILLSDLGSSNGTTVNNRPLSPFVVKEIVAGDRIGFGKSLFVFFAPERLYSSLQESR
ncbi:MAG: FHA domain-containing protein [Magnetococcus sp. MYC-9]